MTPNPGEDHGEGGPEGRQKDEKKSSDGKQDRDPGSVPKVKADIVNILQCDQKKIANRL